MGETNIRFLNTTPLNFKGENSFAMSRPPIRNLKSPLHVAGISNLNRHCRLLAFKDSRHGIAWVLGITDYKKLASRVF